MSLLLEALKKAEKAKEEAQRQAKAAETGDRQPAEAASVQSPARRVVTRAELPDISQPLEILSEDLRADEPRSSPALALEPESSPSPAAAGGAATRSEMPRGGAESRPRVEEPFRERNPQMPFYASLGMLGVIAIFSIAYFRVELRPAPTLVNANPPRPATERTVDPALPKPSVAGTTDESRSTGGKPGIPGLPAITATLPGGAPPADPSRAASATTPLPPAPEQPAPAVRAGRAKAAAPSAAVAARGSTGPAGAVQAKEPPRAVSVNRVTPEVHPRVVAGYKAYQAGDLSTAHGEYQQALREDPANRDALLGLAAVEMRAQRYEQSEAYYERLLQADPRDPHAHAGMLALRSQLMDPVQAESRVKSMLATDPGANVLYFTLGNQYAQQGRWAEAQQAYFKAYAADSENPDFAFNLAVSLDQLRQPGLALEYYRRALALAEKRAASFAPETARRREQQLSR